MKYKKLYNINALSRINGLLFGIAAMRGATITDKLALEAECAAERLDLYIGDLIKEVSTHEGTEESPHAPQSPDQ